MKPKQESKPKSRRGFAAMDPEKRRAIASKGGKSVPDEKRSFSRDSALAAKAGHKGGTSVPKAKRAFAVNPELASAAGRKGAAAKGK